MKGQIGGKTAGGAVRLYDAYGFATSERNNKERRCVRLTQRNRFDSSLKEVSRRALAAGDLERTEQKRSPKRESSGDGCGGRWTARKAAGIPNGD